MSRKQFFLSALLAGILSVGIWFYKVYNKPHVNTEEIEADVVIDAQLLVNEFETNEEQANSKYLDQIIQVRGPINEMLSEDGKTVITIGEGDMFGNVKCNILTEEKIDTNTLKKGQIITIKGICTGYLMNVVLVRSVIIN